jgi:hypothetical protein
MPSHKIKAAIAYPGGTTDLHCDDVVIVAFVGEDTGWKAFSYTVWQPGENRRMALNAAKAILAQLAEDQRDPYGQAAARALGKIHRKIPRGG